MPKRSEKMHGVCSRAQRKKRARVEECREVDIPRDEKEQVLWWQAGMQADTE
jgi:hypothetical protein